MSETNWRVRLGQEAEHDFARILQHTKEMFGQAQVDVYKTTLIESLMSLRSGPNVIGSIARDALRPAFVRSMSRETVDAAVISSFIALRQIA